ncbi:MAG: PorV/PorQ family protein [Elusimicrobia bacterium]|nr:PorV/PorQ family protein [Elusimicrobiota bacterium]
MTRGTLAAGGLRLALWGVLAAVCLPSSSFGFGQGDKGTSAAQFLKIGPGARASGMGEAFSGVADDAFAAYYNPAGLGFLKRPEVAATHESRFRSVNYEHAVAAVPLLSWVETKRPKNAYGVLAFSVSNLGTGKIERRGVTETDAPLETFESNDIAYALSYGYVFPSINLGLGLTVKYVNANIDSMDAGSAAADAGVLWRGRMFSAGLGARHAGDRLVFAKQSEPLPVTFYGGLGFRPHQSFLLTFDTALANDSQPRLSGGAEYRYRPRGVKKLSGTMRAGYATYGAKNASSGGLTGASFGLGVGYDHFEFDAAWVPFGDLGDSFKFSLHVKF